MVVPAVTTMRKNLCEATATLQKVNSASHQPGRTMWSKPQLCIFPDHVVKVSIFHWRDSEHRTSHSGTGRCVNYASTLVDSCTFTAAYACGCDLNRPVYMQKMQRVVTHMHFLVCALISAPPRVDSSPPRTRELHRIMHRFTSVRRQILKSSSHTLLRE